MTPRPSFSSQELEYLTTERRLGRLVTLQPDGHPHVVPVGWAYNADLNTIDISGRQFAATRKFRNVKGDPRVAFLVDDVLAPWQPRSVMIQGLAEAIDGTAEAEERREAMIRISPTRIVSWGLPAEGP